MSKAADWRDIFCGRDTELARLVDAYESVTKGAGPRLAVTLGPDAEGTRLLRDRIAELHEVG